jgi:hypothetical protein
METLEFYVVRSKDGKYLRSKGYGGYGRSWVDELKKAKVYTKKGPACAQVTWWATNYPDYGTPDLVPIIGTLGEPIDQTKRVLESRYKKEIAIIKRELDSARQDFLRAQALYNRLQGGVVEKALKAREEKLNEWEDKLNELTKGDHGSSK